MRVCKMNTVSLCVLALQVYKQIMEENAKVEAMVSAHVGSFVHLLGAVMHAEDDDEDE